MPHLIQVFLFTIKLLFSTVLLSLHPYHSAYPGRGGQSNPLGEGKDLSALRSSAYADTWVRIRLSKTTQHRAGASAGGRCVPGWLSISASPLASVVLPSSNCRGLQDLHLVAPFTITAPPSTLHPGDCEPQSTISRTVNQPSRTAEPVDRWLPGFGLSWHTAARPLSMGSYPRRASI